MILVIGGAFNGKTDFARALLAQDGKKAAITVAEGAVCGEEEIFAADLIKDFHLYLRRFPHKAQEPARLCSELLSRNSGVVVISDELGYGIVPMDQSDRQWREQCGRACTALSAVSEKVYRVVAGIGMCIKKTEKAVKTE